MKPDLSTANQLNLAVFVPALAFGAMADKDFRVQDHLPLLLATLLLIAGTGVVGWRPCGRVHARTRAST